jgi:mannosyl-oligosaccharide alpha-1,2-mannosidase
MMMRFRRYRVFLIIAAALTFVLYRYSYTNSWNGRPLINVGTSSSDNGKSADREAWAGKQAAAQAPAEKKPAEKAFQTLKISSTSTTSTSYTDAAIGQTEKNNDLLLNTPATKTIPDTVIPDRRPVKPQDIYGGYGNVEQDELHFVNPGREPNLLLSPPPASSHWKKQKEHFPVPTESIIQLPTGKPKTIPKIQFAFKDETSDAKLDREKKQKRIRGEFKRAWAGYKKFAWLQDELSPVTGDFRNPFCGWAATLVDSLDTLWIMGLESEFEEAVNAVNSIDFTTSPRADIPVFETTIRYLGGLLAAYDVSGGKYRTLLDKAVELAEVLMGAFDTPNRMPVLFYQWKPAFASQPHLASTRSNLAELGSLSMEFTRLAQLTKEPKYYDAVARITNALADFQKRGTKLPGVFPDLVDASGCNKTSTAPTLMATHQVLDGSAHKSFVNANGATKDASAKDILELQINELTEGEPGKAHIEQWNDEGAGESTPSGRKPSKRQLEDSTLAQQMSESEKAKMKKEDSSIMLDNLECVPQGLVSSISSTTGRDTFSMGGGQDSTYEYFTKVRPLNCGWTQHTDLCSNICYSAVLRIHIPPCILRP